MLLEIEGEDYHLGTASVDGVGEDDGGLVCEVGTILVDDVEESVAELYFGYEFEEREVEVATDARFEIDVKGFEFQVALFLDGEVEHGVDTCHDVGAIVVESLGCELGIEGQGYVCRLHGQELVVAIEMVLEADGLLTEMHGRDGT